MVGGFEAAEFFLAIHVQVVQRDGGFAEGFDGELRDTRLPHSRWPVDEDWVSGVTVDEGEERPRGG